MKNRFFFTVFFRGLWFLFPAVLLSSLILFCTTQTVMGQSKERQQAMIEENYYEKWESEYLSQLRRMLGAGGMENAGITMTRTGSGKEARSYEVLVHHRKLDRMEEKERRDFLAKLERLSFPEETCSFTFRIF